jgi:hypothetical protein
MTLGISPKAMPRDPLPPLWPPVAKGKKRQLGENSGEIDVYPREQETDQLSLAWLTATVRNNGYY